MDWDLLSLEGQILLVVVLSGKSLEIRHDPTGD